MAVLCRVTLLLPQGHEARRCRRRRRPRRSTCLLPNLADAFHKETKPVVDYYAKQGLYSPVNADQESSTVKSIVAAILSK